MKDNEGKFFGFVFSLFLFSKLAKIATLLTVSNAVSINSTPPLNEIYEEVLRNKFESRDNKERLLLEMADLGDELEGKKLILKIYLILKISC